MFAKENRLFCSIKTHMTFNLQLSFIYSMLTRFVFFRCRFSMLWWFVSISLIQLKIFFRHFAAFLSVCRSLVKNTFTHIHTHTDKHTEKHLYILAMPPIPVRVGTVFMTLSSMLRIWHLMPFLLFSPYTYTKQCRHTNIKFTRKSHIYSKKKRRTHSIRFICVHILNSMKSRYSGAVFCSLCISAKSSQHCAYFDTNELNISMHVFGKEDTCKNQHIL